MLDRFFKSTPPSAAPPRGARAPIVGNIYIKRKGRPTIRGSHGNISQGGMFLELQQHDLEQGKKVEVILVTEDGLIKRLTRMRGIILRIQKEGVAFITYRPEDLRLRRHTYSSLIS